MKVKPKEVLLNLPIVLMFTVPHQVPQFAANINQLVHGKSKIKYEELGKLNEEFVGLFYMQRNDEFTALRQQFVEMIEQQQIREHNIQNYLDEKGDQQTLPPYVCMTCGEGFDTGAELQSHHMRPYSDCRFRDIWEET